MFDKLNIVWQKIKWNILGMLNPYYYVWSTDKKIIEEDFRNSGDQDFKQLIINEPLFVHKKFESCTILEIGSGAGRMTEFLAQNFKKVFATDISSSMLRLAKKRINQENIEYIVTNGQNLRIEPNTIDIAFSYIVFQHFTSVNMVKHNLIDLSKCLKAEGIAKIQFRGQPSYGGFLKYFRWYYGISFTEEQIKKLFISIGFKVLSISGNNSKNLWVVFIKN